MPRLNLLAQALIDAPPRPPAPLADLRRRASRRRHRRLLWASPVAVACAGFVAVLVLTLLPSVRNTDLGMEVTDYVVSPRLLDNALTFGPLPTGLHLASDRRINNAGTIEGVEAGLFQRVVVFRGSGRHQHEQLVVMAQQSSVPARGLALFGTEYLRNLNVGSSRSVDIGGRHAAVLGLGSAAPPLGGGALVSNNAVAPGVPTLDSSPDTAVLWQTDAHDQLYVRGQGLASATVVRFAQAISYRPSVDSCIAGTRVVKRTGVCAPGEVSSPSDEVPLVPPGSTLIGHGALHGQSWAIVAGPLGSDGAGVSVSFLYGTKTLEDPLDPVSVFASSSTTTGSFDVATALNGDRFAYGIVPSSVTSITADSSTGHGLSLPVLATRYRGESFFVLYLGKVANKYAFNPSPCPGVSVTLTFFQDSSAVEIVTLPGDRASGFDLTRSGEQSSVGC